MQESKMGGQNWEEEEVSVFPAQEAEESMGELEEVTPEGEPSYAKASEGRPSYVEAEEESKTSLFLDWALKIGLYILAFLIPLFFLPWTSNVLELNKQFLLFLLSFILIILWLAKVLSQKHLEIKKSLVNILIMLFLIAVLVSSLASSNIYQSIIGFSGVIGESLLTLICLAIVYFLAANSFKTKKEIDILFFVLLASAFLVGLFGFLQLSGNFLFSWDFAQMASFNTVGSVNSLEILLAAILMLAVVLFTDQNRPLWQLICLGVSSIILLLMLISLNFANVWWGLIGVATLVVGLGIIKQGRANQTRLILVMIVLAMAMLLTLTKINIAQDWLNIPAEVTPSYQATLDIDKGALAGNLFFGTGPGSFGYNWELYRSELINQTIFWNIRFNQGVAKIFSLPSTLGIVGTGLWIILLLFFAIFGALKLILKRGENWNLCFGFYSAWLFLAVMQFFYPTNLVLEFLFWLFLGVNLMLLGQLKTEPEAGEKKKIISFSFRRESPLASVISFILVIFVVLTISFFYLGARYWWADVLFQRGLVASLNQGDLETGANLIFRAGTLNPYRDNYLTTLSQISLARVNQEIVKPRTPERDTNIQNLIAGSINVAKQAADLNPTNPDNWIQRGLVYRSILGYLSGAEEWMVISFKEAAALQPKNPYTLFELGRSYFILTDFTLLQGPQDPQKQAKALEYLGLAEEQFNKSVAVKSDYSPAHYQLALIYDRQGKTDQAIQKMEMTKVNFPNDVGIAFQLGLLYYRQQDFASSRVEFERAVTLDANYSNARYFLGLIYGQQGERQKAIEQFEKIETLNPDNQEVKKILENLRGGKSALEGIVPPAPSPEQRPEVPVQEKKPETR